MINKILITFLSIATLLFAPLSEASHMIKSNQHPTLREMSIFYDRINVSENWQQWITNYLESSHDTTDEVDEDDILEPSYTEKQEPSIGEKETELPESTEQKVEVPSKPDNKPNNETSEQIDEPEHDSKEEKKETSEEVVNEPVEAPEVTNQSYERQVADLTNKERVAHGLRPLTFDDSLSYVASVKTSEMAELGYFEHTSPTYGSPFEMMDEFGISYYAAAENIAMGQRTPEQVVNGWMNSPGHRVNILNENYTHIGIGYSDNGHYWTQMFIGR